MYGTARTAHVVWLARLRKALLEISLSLLIVAVLSLLSQFASRPWCDYLTDACPPLRAFQGSRAA
jgi:hypothetical protein